MNHGIGKRIISTILSLVVLLQALCVGFVSPVSAATNSKFSDVIVGESAVNEKQQKTEKITQEHFDAINYLADNEFMVGTGKSKTGDYMFSPGITLSRAMVVTVLYRMSGETATGTSKFQDVYESWFSDAVVWGEKTGIVAGVNDKEFLPHRAVQRREAILFLYRYAKKYYGNQLTGFDSGLLSITNRPDYKDIEWAEAQKAMRWAVSYGIIDSKPTDPLKPQEQINRMTFALYVHRMCVNVLGIQSNDKHATQNRDTEYYGRRAIRSNEWNKLVKFISSDSDIRPDDILNLNRELNATNWGACFGLAVTCLLDKTGKIAFNENAAVDARTMSDVPNMHIANWSFDSGHVLDKDIEGECDIPVGVSLVNYYQLLQTLSGYRDVAGDKKKVTAKLCQEMIDSQARGGAAIFSFSFKNPITGYEEGHAVVVYGRPKIDGDMCILSVYDTTSNTTDYIITIKMQQTSDDKMVAYCYYSQSNGDQKVEVKKFNYIPADVFDKFDVDGPKNIISVSKRSPGSSSVLETLSKSNLADTALIAFDAYGEITITNASRQKMHYKDGDIDGNMEILDCYTIDNGPGHPITYILKVKKSNTYNCVVSGAETDLLIIDAEKYANIDGSGVNKIEIAAKSVNVSGNDMDVEVVSSLGCSEDRHLRVIANDETQIDIANTLGNIGVTTKNSAKAVVENSTTRELMHQFEKNAGGITIWGINTDSPSTLDTQVKGSIRDRVKPLG